MPPSSLHGATSMTTCATIAAGARTRYAHAARIARTARLAPRSACALEQPNDPPASNREVCDLLCVRPIETRRDGPTKCVCYVCAAPFPMPTRRARARRAFAAMSSRSSRSRKRLTTRASRRCISPPSWGCTGSSSTRCAAA
eukprot:1290487-Prymnesium_polylepis.1